MTLDLQFIERLFKQRDANLLGRESMKLSAVLLPLIERDDELHVLFEVRAKSMRSQPGEICFPGGGIEEQDDNEAETALRETCEELGLERDQVELIAPLDHLVSPFHVVIYPFVGVIRNPKAMAPNEAEVDEVFTVPVKHLLEQEPELHYVHLNVRPDDSFPFQWIPRGKDYNWRIAKMPEYFYFYEDYIIWGLTARILTHFLDQIRKNRGN